MAQVQLQSANVSFDEGNAYWAGSFTLSDGAEASLFPVGALFEYMLYEETFVFMIEQVNITRQAAEDGKVSYEVSVKCKSPAAVQLTAPLAAGITKTWGTTTARAIVNEVLGSYAASLDWQILDWPIPANTFSTSKQAPLDIARTIVETVGAVIESKPDGTLQVRYLFPVSVAEYGNVTADHEIVDSTDTIGSQDGFVATRIFNRLRICNVDESSTQTDRLEQYQTEEGLTYLRVYPAPWRDNFTISTTRSGVTIGPQVYTERIEKQEVEIVAGKGTVASPILSLVSSDYLSDNLGGVSFAQGGTELTTDVPWYSLLEVVYRVRSFNYLVTNPAGGSAQFLMESE